MINVLNGIRSFYALGLKKQSIALALCTGLSITATYSVTASAASTQVKSNAPNVYVVKKGDTLWDISGRFLDKPWRWPDIWASNKQIKNPHWIYPGDRLLLCNSKGQPLVGRDEGDGCTGIIQRYTGRDTSQPQIRVEQLNNSIPIIPLSDIKPWLERTTIIPSDATQNLPYVIGTADQRVLAAQGQRIYARGQGLIAGQRYAIYRKGEPYLLPDGTGKKQTVGVELLQVASGVATQVENDITTLELTHTYNAEVRRNDLVMLEQDALLPTVFYPTEASQVVEGGQIIRVLGSIGSAAKNSVVTINRGQLEGIQTGQVFAISQQGETVRDPKTKEKIKLPNQKVGVLMIFRTFDQLSYGYILESSLPIKVGALVSPPRSDD